MRHYNTKYIYIFFFFHWNQLFLLSIVKFHIKLAIGDFHFDQFLKSISSNFLVILNLNNFNRGDLNQNRDFDFENHNFDFKIKIIPNSDYGITSVKAC